MAIGASGNRIVAVGKLIGFETVPELPGSTRYLVLWQISEPTTGTISVNMTSNTALLTTTVEPTDSEIQATLRAMLAAAITAEFSDMCEVSGPFLESDIRGCSL